MLLDTSLMNGKNASMSNVDFLYLVEITLSLTHKARRISGINFDIRSANLI